MRSFLPGNDHIQGEHVLLKDQKEKRKPSTRLHPVYIPIGVSVILIIITGITCFSNMDSRAFLLNGTRTEKIDPECNNNKEHCNKNETEPGDNTDRRVKNGLLLSGEDASSSKIRKEQEDQP